MNVTWKPVFSLVVLAVAVGTAGCHHTQARSDAEIAGEIQGKVSADPVVQNKQIAVQAASGVVTLSGAVASEGERSAAAADAASVAGVRTVVNNLSVTPFPPQPQAAMEQPAPAAASEAYAPRTRTRDRHERHESARHRHVARNDEGRNGGGRNSVARNHRPSAAAQRHTLARPSYAQAPSYAPAKPRYTQAAAAQPRMVAAAQQSNEPEPNYEPQQADDQQQQQDYEPQQPADAPPPPEAQQPESAEPPAAARPAPPPRSYATPPPQRRNGMVRVPSGTSLSVRMVDSLNSETAQTGDSFRATLNAPIELDGGIVVPADADLVGRVVEVKSAGRFKGEALLTIELTRLRYNGQSYAITTTPWTQELKGRGKGTAAKVGGGAALGAIIGGIAGGGKGAAIGTVVGGGAGATAQGVTKQNQIRLEPETLLTFRLDQPVTVHPASVNERTRERRRLD